MLHSRTHFHKKGNIFWYFRTLAWNAYLNSHNAIAFQIRNLNQIKAIENRGNMVKPFRASK